MAEDMLQEGFIRVFTRLDSFRAQGSLEGWIRRVMVTTSLEMLRKKDVLRFGVDLDNAVMLLDEPVDIPEVADPEEVLRLLQGMPDGFRTIFNLFAIEDYKHSEIAQMLGISEGTSKSQYARARLWLQKKLKEIR